MEIMPLVDFSLKYDISLSSLSQWLKANPEYKIEAQGFTYIKSGLIEKKKKFQEDLYQYTTTIYYLLIEIFGTEYKLAKRLAMVKDLENSNVRNWASWINKDLFILPPESIIRFSYGKRRLAFARIGSKLLYLYNKESKNDLPNEFNNVESDFGLVCEQLGFRN